MCWDGRLTMWWQLLVLREVADYPDNVQPVKLRQGKRVRLRPVGAHDYDFLYFIATAGENSYRWRYRGTTPSPEAFARQLWDGILAQYLAMTTQGKPVGLVGLYNTNPFSGYSYIYALSDPSLAGQGRTMEAAILLLDYAFRNWNLRKIYFELPEFNLAQLRSAVGKYLVEEGRLIDHEVFGGRSWDLITLALYREVFVERCSRIVDAISTNEDQSTDTRT